MSYCTTAHRLLGGRLGAKGVPTVDFDLAEIAFTRGMRKSPGTVFAGAPIVQGNWDGSGVPDVLSFPRGAQISGHFYENFDGYQGGGVADVNPEQSSADRADSNHAYIWYASGSYYLRYEYDNNRYRLRIGGQTLYVAATVTAGTVEYLAWGFDTNNTLDGTNYLYFSRNNVQTYGAAVQPTAAAVDGTIRIGNTIGAASPANGIIEGLVFVREIPWTGAYGTDMGQGDIVAFHAAGNDVALSIASWGTTYSMPTDATPGALVTGPGEAWSHPHSSNLLGTDEGFMTAAAWNNWAMVGTPINPAVLADAEKNFDGGYKFDTDAVNEGYYRAYACAPGDDFVIRAITHSSAGTVRVELWDATGAASIGYVDGMSVTRNVPNVHLF